MQLKCLIVLCAFASLFIQGAFAKNIPELQLANVFNESVDVADYWVSEKYDGIRAYWDGNQLVTRNGNVIHAPDWFTQGFPSTSLDGELWIARGKFEQTLSIVSKDVAIDAEWQLVKLMVFDLPADPAIFEQRLVNLNQLITQADLAHLRAVKQIQFEDKVHLQNHLAKIVEQGAEGLMLHHRNSIYQATRNNDLLKLKLYQDSEAKVIAYLPGKGKFTGILGALLVETAEGIRFRVGTGFSLQQRKNPPPIGSYITFKYFGFTKNGIPKFASFLRQRDELF